MTLNVSIELTPEQVAQFQAGQHVLMTARFEAGSSGPVHALARTLPYPAVLEVEREWVETLTFNDPDNE